MAVAEILLLRHAEKPKGADGQHGFTPEGLEDGKSLSIRGWQRAGALAALLAPNPLVGPRLPSPDRIYASAFRKGGGHSRRPEQTVLPLAQRLGLTVNSTWALHEERVSERPWPRRRASPWCAGNIRACRTWPAPSPCRSPCRGSGGLELAGRPLRRDLVLATRRTGRGLRFTQYCQGLLLGDPDPPFGLPGGAGPG